MEYGFIDFLFVNKLCIFFIMVKLDILTSCLNILLITYYNLQPNQTIKSTNTKITENEQK